MRNSCPCPSGCVVGERIDPCEPEDSVRVICSNAQCQVGLWVHAVCFTGWEADLGSGDVWTPTALASSTAARACPCGSGLLQKDTAFTPPPAPAPGMDDGFKLDDGFKQAKARNRRRTNSRQLPSPISPPSAQPAAPHHLAPRLRNRAASLGSNAVAVNIAPKNNHSPPHSLQTQYSAPHHHHNHHHHHNQRRERNRSDAGPGSEFFTDTQVDKTGSIFARRQGLGTLYAVLPRWKVNGFHIKLEDDCPQGNDDTRIFLLTTLGDHKMREIGCILCRSNIKVYDKYPLVDGTFFLSPINQNGEGLPVRYDTRDSFLHAMCVECLETGSGRLWCRRCGGRGWFPGPSLVLGSLYAYDILSSRACCPPLCRGCGRALPLPDPAQNQAPHFSAFSELSNCRHCGHRDSHYVRRLDSIRFTADTADSLTDSSSSGYSPLNTSPAAVFPLSAHNTLVAA